MKKPLIITLVAVVAAVVIGLGVWIGLGQDKSVATPQPTYSSQAPMSAEGDHSHPAPAPSTTAPAPVATEQATVPENLVQKANPDDPAVKEATGPARSFVLSYGVVTFKDAAPTDWIARSAQFTTPELAAALKAEYGAGTADMSAIKAAEAVQANEALVLTVLSGPADGKLIFSAHYDQTVSSKESKGTVVLGSQDKMLTMSLVDGRWQVSAFGPMLGGGA